MIRVYYLRQLKDITENVEYTEGSEYISHAISKATENPAVRRVIIEENRYLSELALRTEEPTMQDLDDYNSLSELSPPSRNLEEEVDDLKGRVGKLETRQGERYGME